MRYSKTHLGYILICAGILLYLCLRAFFIPLVHDEAATFFHYIHTGKFLPYLSHEDANNHFLNSFLTWMMYSLFGNSEFTLRLPNLLSFILFLYYVFLTGKEISNPYLQWLFYFTMLFSHGFIEFFALSRGYGLSFSFLVAGVWHTSLVLKNNKPKDYFFSLLFIFLSLASNLNLLVIAVLNISALLFNVAKERLKSGAILNIAFIMSMGILPVAFFIKILFEMKGKGLLYHGEGINFYEVTVKSISSLLFSGYRQFSAVLFFTILGVAFIAVLSLLLFKAIKSKKRTMLYEPHLLFFYFFAGNIMAVLLMKYLLGVNYPEDRTGLHLFPLFIITYFLCANRMIQTSFKNIVIIASALFLILPVHFIYKMNLTNSSLWHRERIPVSFHEKVKSSIHENNTVTVLSGPLLRGLCWSYYNIRHGTATSLHSEGYPRKEAGFLIAEIADTDIYNVVDSDRYSGYYLLHRKKPVNKNLIMEKKELNNGDNFQQEYFNLYESKADTFTGKSLLIQNTFSVNSSELPFVAWLVVTVFDKENKPVIYDFISFDWLKTKWNGEPDNFNFGLMTDKIPGNADRIVVYIWNINKKFYSIKNAKFAVYETIL